MIILFFVQPKDSANRRNQKWKFMELQILHTVEERFYMTILFNVITNISACFFEESKRVLNILSFNFLMLYQLIFLVITPINLLSFQNYKIGFSAPLDNKKNVVVVAPISKEIILIEP